MFDVLVRELSDRYGLGDRSRDLFGLLMGYIYNDRRGGFGGFAESFRQQGHGDLFASWLGGDARRQRTLNASEVGMVFGQGLLSDWGNRIGASRATVAAAIAGVLPRLIGELTPGGRVPEAFGTVATTPVGVRREEPDADADVEIPSLRAVETPVQRFDDRISSANLRRDNGRIEPAVAPPVAAIDPHVAAITAAVSGSAPAAPAFATDDPLRDIEFRRPNPQRKRGGFGWLLWLLILLVLAAGAAYYWQDYLPLDGVQMPWSTQPAAT